MSGGRVELGIGAGWYEAEHRADAIPFPPLGERFDRLEEQLAYLTGMWETPDGARYEHTGRHYQVVDSPGLPKPVLRPGPPIIIGGGGTRRTPDLCARFGSEFNRAFVRLEYFVAQSARVREACEGYDRDPDELVYSAALERASVRTKPSWPGVPRPSGASPPSSSRRTAPQGSCPRWSPRCSGGPEAGRDADLPAGARPRRPRPPRAGRRRGRPPPPLTPPPAI